MRRERRLGSFRRRRGSLNVGRRGLLEYHVERSGTINQKSKILSSESHYEGLHFVIEEMGTVC